MFSTTKDSSTILTIVSAKRERGEIEPGADGIDIIGITYADSHSTLDKRAFDLYRTDAILTRAEGETG